MNAINPLEQKSLIKIKFKLKLNAKTDYCQNLLNAMALSLLKFINFNLNECCN